ncbi:unnamed protein product, partial [Ectocarpus sp. 12 AP-2014]
MRVVVTGANGFIGKNLLQHLGEREDVVVIPISRRSTISDLEKSISSADFVFHLAGVNRPVDPAEFQSGNAELTERLCELLKRRCRETGEKVPVVFSSSIQAERDNVYGKSKRDAEQAVFELNRDSGDWPAFVFRLPNVFGKWSRPNYNSAVATFCHNISQGLPVHINDPKASLTLVYVDDVINRFVQLLDG